MGKLNAVLGIAVLLGCAVEPGVEGDFGSIESPLEPRVPGASIEGKCGGSHTWLRSPELGRILERKSVWGHSSLDLRLTTLKLLKDKAIITKRWPRFGTSAKLIRYQTQDRGVLIDATALVTYPNRDGDFPVMLVLHGTSGFTDACAPTRGAIGSGFDGFTDDVGLAMAMYASYGYITVFPDYIGLKSFGGPTGFLHPYLIAEPTAVASLDAVRAAKSIFGGGVRPGDVVVIGGSQGGHAAAFVDRFAPYYAPELRIRGSVWDVPPTDMLEQTRVATSNQWINASSNALAFLTAADAWYASAPGRLGEVVNEPYRTLVPSVMSTECSGLDVPTPSLASVFTPTFLGGASEPAFESLPSWSCYLRENSLPTSSVPRIDNTPSLFLLAEKDTLVNNDVERKSFTKLCQQGHSLQYLECKDASHTKPLAWAYDQVLDFLEARLRGESMPSWSCQIQPAQRCSSQPYK